MPTPDRPAGQIDVRGRLTGADVGRGGQLVRLAAEEDGVAPLSEHVMLHLRYGGDRRARNCC